MLIDVNDMCIAADKEVSMLININDSMEILTLKEDDMFIAACPWFEGMIVQENTEEKALKSLRECIVECLKILQQHGSLKIWLIKHGWRKEKDDTLCSGYTWVPPKRDSKELKKQIEDLEDILDLKEGLEAMEDISINGTISWEECKKELDL